MASGIKINDAVVAEVKKLRDNHELACVVIKVTEKCDAVEVCEEVDTLGTDGYQGEDEEHSFGKVEYDGAVCNHVKEQFKGPYEFEPVYIILDLHTKEGDKAGNDKVYMLSWVPENCKVKRKMVHASTLNELKKAIGIGDKCYEIHDQDEFESLVESLNCPGAKKTNIEKARVKSFNMVPKVRGGIKQ